MPATLHSAPPLEAIYGKVEADSRFCLHYLRTVEAVVKLAGDVRNNAETAEWAINGILPMISGPGGYDAPVDPDDELARQSASAEEAVRETILAFRKFGGALDGAAIRPNDALVISKPVKNAIAALQNLHDALVDLRWAVMEHDADLEEPEDGTFDSAEELIAELRSC